MPHDALPLAEEPVASLRLHAEILCDFGRMAAESADPDRLVQLACVQAARGTGICRTKALRFRPEAGDLLIVAGVGWRPGVVGQVSLGTDLASLPGQAFRTRLPNVVDDLPHSAEFRYPAVLREHGIVSALNVPVAVDGDTWGVLEVDSDRPSEFGPDDVRFVTALANTLALALRGHRGARETLDVTAGAARALAQERMMRTELQHRAKNDLQLVLSLLVMQRRGLEDEEARRIFGHVMDRVAAIGLAHDQLNADRGAGLTIDLAEYLRTLCRNLSQRREGVVIETALEPAEMSHSRAVPLGLIVNELVTNALKHAFPGGRPGVIRVEFDIPPGGEGRLLVRDDGAGMGPPRPGSSGTTLIRRLVQQVGGRMEGAEQERGTGFRILFPLVT